MLTFGIRALKSTPWRLSMAAAAMPGAEHRRRMPVELWLAIAAMVLLAATATISLVLASAEMGVARLSQAKVQHTLQVTRGIDALVANLNSARSLERAFVITGDTETLASYERADRLALDSLREVEDDIQDAAGLRLFNRLETLTARQLDMLRSVVSATASGSFADARELVRQNIRSGEIDRIVSLAGELSHREHLVLDGHLALFSRQSSVSERFSSVALYATITLTLFVMVVLLRYNRARVSAETSSDNAFARLHATLERISQGVAVFDGQMRPLIWNPRFGDLCDLSPTNALPDEFITSLVRRLAPASGHLPQAAHVAAKSTAPDTAARAGHDFDVETRIGERELQLAGRTMSNGEYVVTLTDMSALKRSERNFREQAVRLNTTLDSIKDAIVAIDASGSIETWSKGAEAMFGYSAAEVLRRNVSLLMPEPHSAAHDGYLRRYLDTGKSRIIGTSRELVARHQDGHHFPIDASFSEMTLGSRRMFVGIIRDISVRLQVEQLKSGFISTVSHELRTPLTSISGSLGLLAGGAAGPLGAKVERLVHIAHANSERLLRLINDILDLDKAESGGLQLNCQAVSLLGVIRQAMEGIQDYVRKLGVELELEPVIQDAEVLIDQDRLIQVLTNLIANAAKFSPRDGRVRIRIVADGTRVRIEVIDNGCGIDAEFRQQVFQKFAQADSSDARTKGGTGLGLSISKALVECMGGWIGFWSEPGHGAVFHVTFPLHNFPLHNTESPKPTVGSPESAAWTTRPVVLVCEDDPDIAGHTIATMAAHGIHTEWAQDLAAAQALLRTSAIDAAIVDLDLPDGDGIKFITTLRADALWKDLPVIVWTARSRADGSARPLDGDASLQWLRKPTAGGELLDAVRAGLARACDQPKRRIAALAAVPNLQEA